MTLDIEVGQTHSYQLENGVVTHNTSSLFLGSASGIHPHHSRKYIRRIQCNKVDNVYKHFKKNNKHATEEGVWSANKTDDVVSFPVIVDDDAMIKADLSAIDHLKIIRDTQEDWVLNGADNHEVKNNVSCTVLVKEHEWKEVINYLYAHMEYFSAVSLLSDIGEKIYAQAPLQSILTEEDEKMFAELMAKWKHIDWDSFKENDDNTNLTQESSCAGGKCELVSVGK